MRDLQTQVVKKMHFEIRIRGNSRFDKHICFIAFRLFSQCITTGKMGLRKSWHTGGQTHTKWHFIRFPEILIISSTIITLKKMSVILCFFKHKTPNNTVKHSFRHSCHYSTNHNKTTKQGTPKMPLLPLSLEHIPGGPLGLTVIDHWASTIVTWFKSPPHCLSIFCMD